MTFKTRDDDEPKSNLPNLTGLSREAAQKVLKTAYDNFDRSINNLYTRGVPNQNLADLSELIDLCDAYGVSIGLEPGQNPDHDASLERRRQQQLQSAERNRKEGLREILRKRVAAGELPELPAAPPRNLGKHPGLARVLKEKFDNEFFDEFYGIK